MSEHGLAVCYMFPVPRSFSLSAGTDMQTLALLRGLKSLIRLTCGARPSRVDIVGLQLSRPRLPGYLP